MDAGRVFFAALWWAGSGLGFMMLRRTTSEVARRLAAVKRTPTSAIAQAPREGTIEIVGRVVASERGLVQSGATARPSVFARTLVERVNGSSRQKVLDHVATQPFLVDDGSGATAWVETDDNAHVAVEPSRLDGGRRGDRTHRRAAGRERRDGQPCEARLAGVAHRGGRRSRAHFRI